MTKQTENTAGQKGTETVTEEDLLKSLSDLEGKKDEKKEEKKEPVIETAALKKSATDALAEGASEELKKSLDVSDTLKEITNLLGAHVDSSLETLQKSIQAGAERDLKMITVLTELKKSIDANTAAIEKFGETPAGKPAAVKTPAGGATVEVLKKSTTGGEGGEQQPAKIGKKDVLTVMESLVKSCTKGSGEEKRWIDATIKFESSGQISNADLVEVQKKLNPAKAA